ncbi:uncharacterized protein N7482_009766 [Penicillium canariense]|uniref:DNA replication checkpoint mediator MRC1 domain-containing protein n=1 Tax=Penicillium canariense TaxID=189055 RepID=A0A9W9HN44_9EURO|nr:uncharacterized protein N7482_009766 [Penicillium canariense]KAJ5153288.1 hypothetical protein N7482_009766 [Penicillium canariense]
MSSPSTPRSTRSASSAGNSPNILTPGQKIKAMMAEFDSDSESDSQNTNSKASIPKLDFTRKNTLITETRVSEQMIDSEDDLEDADDFVRPKGRMAARMQGNAGDSTSSEPQKDSAFSRLSKALQSEREQGLQPTRRRPPPVDESSDDDLPAAGPRRRKNAKSTQLTASADHDSLSSPPRTRTVSPLFVSSPAAPQDDANDLDQAAADEPGEQSKSKARFLALVAQKRKEREQRERFEDEQKAARRAQMEQFSSEILSGEESVGDEDGSARKLSQKARQPRKASKKALEEMRQETQRMSRNMQLAHQAQTKKKITKESLFARFNFMQPEPSPAEAATTNSSSTAGSQHSSDGEGPQKTKETPHTSPVLGPSDADKPLVVDASGQVPPGLDAASLAALKETMPSAQDAPQGPKVSSVFNAKKVPRRPTQPPVRVLMSRQEVARHQQEDSDSDDLEVVTSPSKARRFAAFENLPTRKLQESASMLKLKALAHLTSPTRKMTTMNSAELSASLLYKARQQAAKERRERIEELRAKGVVIETAEERAAMEDDVEDLVEKARQEANEIGRQERAAKKKAQGLDDEEEDDDYAFSGSDEDASDEGDYDNSNNDDDDGKGVDENPEFVDQEADEGDESAEDQAEDILSDADVEIEDPGSRRKRRTRVVDDDEDEEPQVPSTPVRPPSHGSQSVERPAFPDMQTPGDMPMGLTQAFAGTLADDDDTSSQPGSTAIPFSLPDPGRPVPGLRAEDSEILVCDSQEQSHEPDFMTGYSPNVTRVSESPAAHTFSQFSQLPDPTQDEGFVFSPFDPAKRFRGTPPVSTVDTVLLGQSQSPVAERKHRQLRRGRAVNLSVVEEEDNEGDIEVNANAFNVMQKAVKKRTVQYDKKNSKAKNIVDEAAEESEDEYAGLGGASDDSDGEEDAYDQQMINDQSGEVVDEKQLAALNAVHQRDRDEKDVAKLYKDITTGALRRRRGGGDDDFDLDDSDDERLARRREKQREFAKMRRALLADDKIGELAENPKKAAFFKAIEDRDIEDDFELEFLEERAGDSQNEASQDVAQQQGDPSQDSSKRKRPLEPSAEDATNRPPPHLRRTPASAMSKKPATLAEIRETLSFLTETPEYDSFHEDASLDEEELAAGEDDTNTSGNEDAYSEDAGSQSKEGFAVPSHPRRTRGMVVDRLALLRQASSNSASATTSGSSSNTKFAFHNGGNSDGPIGFRPPQFLRRANTGSSSSSSSSMSSASSANRVSKPAASGPKKGGAVNSYTAAREKERERELRMKQRNGGSNIAKLLGKHAGGGLGALAGKGQWD